MKKKYIFQVLELSLIEAVRNMNFPKRNYLQIIYINNRKELDKQ